MGFKLNLTNDEIKSAQGGFATLPKGTYAANIFSNTFKMSKATPPNPMFEIEFKITQGQAGIGRKIRGWFVLTPKALFKVIELHKALGGADEGFPYPDKNTDPGDFEFPETDEYLGKPVNIVIDVENYASVANGDDVLNGVLNSDTEQPVKAEGEPVTKTRNTLKYVRAYDEDTLTSEDDEGTAAGGDIAFSL